MLKEGKEYTFIAEKEIETPDNKKQWVLKGPQNIKYLIPSSYYVNYGIKPGNRLVCRIDKINCKGQVFLEPKHPLYIEGRIYKFRIVRFDKRSDDSGQETDVIILSDIFGNEIPIPFPERYSSYTTGDAISLKVERIYKGKPVLYKPSGKGRFKGLKYGNTCDFRVEKVTLGFDNEEYFLVSDQNGNFHTVQKKYYEYYNLVPGSKFRGRIIKYSRNGPWKIEPLNPYYKPGMMINLMLESFTTEDEKKFYTLILKDEFGFSHILDSRKKPEQKIVTCRVRGIRKGKPELVIL